MKMRAFLFVTAAVLSLPAIAQTRIDCVASIIDGNLHLKSTASASVSTASTPPRTQYGFLMRLERAVFWVLPYPQDSQHNSAGESVRNVKLRIHIFCYFGDMTTDSR